MAAEALGEVTEGLLLYTSLQLNHLSRNSVKQLNPGLKLWAGPTGKEGESSNRGEAPQLQREFQVQILASGLGCYYLDAASFLKTLCDHSSSFKRCLITSIITEVQLLCRRIGEHTTVTCCNVDAAISPTEFQETVIPRPEYFNPATILIKCKVNLSCDQLRVEMNKLTAQLHLIHITNPEIGLKCTDLSLNSAVLGDSDYVLHLVPQPFKQFTRTRIKLVTSLSHFCGNHSSLPGRQLKLRLLKGDVYTIPTCVFLANGSKVTLKLFCTAAVVPCLSLKNGRKIPANRLYTLLSAPRPVCGDTSSRVWDNLNCAKISVFDPSGLPLIVAGSKPNFPLGSLAVWDSYGMELRPSHLSSTFNNHCPSYVCEISNLRTPPTTGTSGAPHSTSMALNRHLELFIFLEEDTSDQEMSGLGKNCQWKRSFELHHKLRDAFQSLVVAQSKKFHRAVHSALNKFICNYGSHAKTKSIMATVIPLISDSIASIIKHSTNSSFEEDCRGIMQVGTGEDVVSSWVREKLWQAAGDKLGAVPPSESSTASSNPDEPTSPELILAAGGGSTSDSATPTRDESDRESNIEQGIIRESITSEAVHQLQNTSTNSKQETQVVYQPTGLFQARIASNTALIWQTFDENSNSSEDFDFEALSTFEERSPEGIVVASDSDETVVSDFDELEGVSEGELSFSDESQPSSPLVLSTMPMLKNVTGKNNYTCISVGSTADIAGVTPVEPMDTIDAATASLDETNCFIDEDTCNTLSPKVMLQDMDPTTSQDATTQHSVCTPEEDDGLAAALSVAGREYDQHSTPGTWQQLAKKPTTCYDDDDDDDKLSHLSDNEWTELSFQSPVFLQAENRGNHSTSFTHNVRPTSTATQLHSLVPPGAECWTVPMACQGVPNGLTQMMWQTEAGHSETQLLTQTIDLQRNSAFDCLENYDDSPSEDDAMCNPHVVPLSSKDGGDLCGVTHTPTGVSCGVAVGVAAQDDGLLTCDVTDEDFCWESEQEK